MTTSMENSSYFQKLREKMSGAQIPDTPPEEPTKEAPKEEPKEQPIVKEVVKDKEVKSKLIVPKEPKQFFLTQTLIKEVTDKTGDLREDICPRAIYEQFITKKFRHVTPPMMEGIYGETLMLGGGAKGQKVIDLPRHKKTGEKLKAQRSIEEQALRFPIWCNEKGISVIKGVNTQLPIVKRLDGDDKVLIRTELDLFPTPFFMSNKDSYVPAIIDLKMTANVQSEWGDYCWGAPEFIDHIQADMAYWMIQDFDMELNLKFNPEKEEIYQSVFGNKAMRKMIESEKFVFVYFIVGYKKEPLEEQVNFIYRAYRDPNGSDFRQREWKERARKTLAQLSEWRANNWPPLEGNRCQKCPVNQENGGYCNVQSIKKV